MVTGDHSTLTVQIITNCAEAGASTSLDWPGNPRTTQRSGPRRLAPGGRTLRLGACDGLEACLSGTEWGSVRIVAQRLRVRLVVRARCRRRRWWACECFKPAGSRLCGRVCGLNLSVPSVSTINMNYKPRDVKLCWWIFSEPPAGFPKVADSTRTRVNGSGHAASHVDARCYVNVVWSTPSG